MLEEATKETIREALEAVRERLPGFRPRFAQRKMIAEVARTLAGGADPQRRILCVEGPTGTGKTLSYLLAGIPVAAAEGKALVISSATVALQEQLVSRDLPDVARLSGLEFDFALAKGRGRYACRRDLVRFTEGSGQDDLYSDEASWERPPEAAEVETLAEMLRAWDQGEWDGDLDTWPQELAGGLRRRAASDRHACTTHRCRYFNQCSFYRARARLDEAQVVVANHDLVLSDLAMGGGVILPSPEDTFYVFDEAHHLADKALNHFSAAAGIRGASNWLSRCPKTADAVARELPEAGDLPTKVTQDAEQAVKLLKAVGELIDAAGWLSGDSEQYRFPNTGVPDALGGLGRELHALAAALLQHFRKLSQGLDRALDQDRIATPMAEGLGPGLGLMIQRLENLDLLWEMISRAEAEGAPLCRWLSRHTAEGEDDVQVCASLIDVSALYQERLWSSCAGAVLTSATLTSLGSFQTLQRSLGLGVDDGTQYLRLETPFDYRSNASLHIPAMAAEPGDSDAHTREIIQRLPDLLGGEGGSLVLFSSRWQMERVAEGLPAGLRKDLLIQDRLSKQVLLQRHREAVEAGRRSVLFGLASFAEGIDLPGDLCRHVIIAKLPFAVPTSPIEESTAEWVRSRGGNPFMEISVPQASLRLLQATGRLLRKEDDQGRVTILDRRLVSKRYGQALLDALPPFQLEVERPG